MDIEEESLICVPDVVISMRILAIDLLRDVGNQTQLVGQQFWS